MLSGAEGDSAPLAGKWFLVMARQGCVGTGIGSEAVLGPLRPIGVALFWGVVERLISALRQLSASGLQ